MKPVGKKPLLLLAFLALSPFSALADRGGAGPSGGDGCENRFDSVVADIKDWMRKGGHKNLDFGGKTDAADYEKKMTAAMEGYHVECVRPNDPKKPMDVNGVSKECINWKEEGTNRPMYRCELGRFYIPGKKDADNDPLHYRMVHHELASRAGLEPANGAKSSYALSDQLDAFLEDRVMKRLAIKPQKKEPDLVSLKLSKLVKSQTTFRRKYPPPHCLETIKKVEGFERDGKKPRVVIEEKSCPGEPAVSYHVKVFTQDGDEIRDEGIALNIHEGVRHMRFADRMPPGGQRLQRIFLRMNSGTPCLMVQISPEGQLVDTLDCKFSNKEAPLDEAPLDEGVAPAA